VPRVIVWHNAVARIPFPTNLFRGAYDTHFGIVRVEDGEVEQDVTYEGSDVPNRLRLFQTVQYRVNELDADLDVPERLNQLGLVVNREQDFRVMRSVHRN